MKTRFLLTVLTALLFSYGVTTGNAVVKPAVAKKPATGKELYTAKNCHTCHGAEGKKPVASIYPKVNGQSSQYTLTQMKDIKSGKRSNGLSMAMKAMTSTVKDEEFKKIADYLATIK